MIDHAGYLISFVHGEMHAGPWDAPLLPATFPGVKGESHLTDERKGRTLVCELLIDQQATEAVLNNTIEQINAITNRVTGTLTVTTDSAVQYPKCTFLGYQESDRFRDGVNNKWVSRGRLAWRQRGPGN